ncbi:MAG: hypothetical protein AAGF12_04645 [Myxococcota bacterium]
MSPEEAYAAGLEGDYRNISGALENASEAEACALRALLAAVSPNVPVPELPPGEADVWSERALRLIALNAFLDENATLARAAEDASERTSTTTATRAVVSTVRHLISGEPVSYDSERVAEPEARIALSAFEAWAALKAGRAADGLERARRVARMARTEEMQVWEYLAYITLAEARRQTDSPYRASRILDSLSTVIPSRWDHRREWSGVFVGKTVSSTHPAFPLLGLFDALRAQGRREHGREQGREHGRGHGREQVDTALLRLDEAAPPSPLYAEEVQAIISSVRGALDGSSRGGVRIFDPIRPGLRALSRSLLDGPPVLIAAFPDRPPERYLRFVQALDPEAPPFIFEDGTAGPRAREIAARLVIAGQEGLSSATLFESVYGFAFEESRHGNVLRTAIYRTRAALGEHAEIESLGGQWRVRVRSPFLWPQSEEPEDLEERILRQLTTSPDGCTARDTAAALGIPVRTVQATLRRMVDDGSCSPEKLGRRVHYVIEDTTFQSPTLPRLVALGAGE